MRHPLSSPLIALATLAVAGTWTHLAGAQEPLLAAVRDAGASTCGPITRELDACRRSLTESSESSRGTERELVACRQELESTTSKAQQSTEAAAVCQRDRDRICAATAAFASDLAKGRSRAAAETGCVSAEEQARLDGVVNGWVGASTWVTGLAAYASGETDVLPRPRAGATALERALLRVGRDGTTRGVHRRLLVEALRLVAPRTWESIRAGGASAIDAWFADASPLGPELVAEAQSAPVGAPGPAGPPLTAALHLVRAFQVAARCTSPSPDAPECVRAAQLQKMLESTGSLVMRRRVQEIWATECSDVSPETTLPWVEDFPSAQLGGADDAWADIAEAALAKLFACYLDDPTKRAPFATWLQDSLPSPKALTTTRLRRVDAIRARWKESSPEATCVRAVRAMQTITVPATCAVPNGEFRDALRAWSAASRTRDDASVALSTCSQFAELLWLGKAASINGSFAHPPSLDEMVAAQEAPPTPMSKLRSHCDERRGSLASFPVDIAALTETAKAFGEGVDRSPFRVDPATSVPLERVRHDAVQGAGPWFDHVARGRSACATLGLSEERCRVCADAPTDALYDCALVAQLESTWSARTRSLVLALASLAAVALGATWLRRLVGARRRFGRWAREASAFLHGLGLASRTEWLRWLVPSRHDTLLVELPPDAAWERWGTRAVVVRAPPGPRVLERDVNHAAFVARRVGVAVALLEHDDGASPEMSAIRAMLEWAARGGSRAVQVLPIGAERLRWSKSAQDVLELVEESSLRGNAFELRGRIATSTQFFNRERLVSGLLAAAQAGHWMVVTGLRRFGKSSLALEVARRLPGPSAYVDLAGFDHEIGTPGDPGVAADEILRFVCLRLVESARAFWPDATFPDAPAQGAHVDVAALTLWFRELSRACQEASRRPAPLLVIIDEMEQALAGGPERLGHALDVLAIVIGRLKSALGDAGLPDGSSPVGVFLTSALHPLLWAPLRTLAHQSIMGSFQRVCVPCLDDDAATTMMRSLGARQGVRFTEPALELMVRESQGVPLLLRRFGGAVLELYDAERARQGSLGAVEVGIEGSREAIEREAREGSPVRVWVETEIAAANTAVGALLRALARAELVTTEELTAIARRHIAEDFARTGIAATLAPDELARRTDEAAHVMIQLLDESGLVVASGDLTAPDGYGLPDGTLRRVLAVQPSLRTPTRPPA